jgi:Flp pilus assembly protein CpaB
VITLLVDPHEAERLARAARQGKIDIALRNPQDSEVTEAKVALIESTKGPEAEAKEPGWGLKVRRSRKPRKRRRRRARPVMISSASESERGRVRIYRGGK